MALQFIMVPNAGRKLIFENYIFVKQKELADGVISWECSKRRNVQSCRAKVRIRNDIFLGRTNDHTCSDVPNLADVAVLKARIAMTTHAQTSDDRTQAIIGANTQNLSEEERANLPDIETMRRSIRRAREGDNPPAPPAVNRGFVIPPEYQNMENGDPFLRFDNNDPNDRILIFGTDDSLGFLANADDWYMDGTFTVAPPQFNQLYTVHGLSGDHHVVGCYALLPNKNRGTYVELLQQDHRLTNGAAPQTIMIDFEQVCIGAITMVFPNASVYGCLFHLTKSIYRHVQANGLQQQYLNDNLYSDDWSSCIRTTC